MKNFLKYLIYALVGYLCLMLASCRTQKEIEYITIEKVRTLTDTVRIASTDTIKDSIVITYTDSIKYVDRWHTKIVTSVQREIKTQTDTLYRDNIKTVIKEVEKPLRIWQKMLISFGLLSIMGVLAFLYFKMRS